MYKQWLLSAIDTSQTEHAKSIAFFTVNELRADIHFVSLWCLFIWWFYAFIFGKWEHLRVLYVLLWCIVRCSLFQLLPFAWLFACICDWGPEWAFSLLFWSTVKTWLESLYRESMQEKKRNILLFSSILYLPNVQKLLQINLFGKMFPNDFILNTLNMS